MWVESAPGDDPFPIAYPLHTALQISRESALFPAPQDRTWSPAHAFSQSHGVPPFSLEIGSTIETIPEEEVQAFHLFADKDGEAAPYLPLGYLPHMQTQPHSLLPMIILQIVEQLERLFPAHLTLLSIIKRNFSWKLKIESIG
jgi:hypothetical protein